MKKALVLITTSRNALGEGGARFDKERKQIDAEKIGKLTKEEIIHEANLADFMSLQIDGLLFLEKIDRYYTTARQKVAPCIKKHLLKLEEKRRSLEEQEER